jgi:hypothetical protein
MLGPNFTRWHHAHPPRPRPWICAQPGCDAELTHAQRRRCPEHALARQRDQTRRWKQAQAVREALFAARVEAAKARSFEPRAMRVAGNAEGAA